MKDLFGVEMKGQQKGKKTTRQQAAQGLEAQGLGEKENDDLLSEVAPGKYVTTVEVWELPSYVLSKLVPTGSHSYKLEPVQEWCGYIRIKEINATLGIQGISYRTWMRLCIEGYLEHIQIAPMLYLVKVDSLIEHMKRTKNTKSRDSDFWTQSRRQSWRETAGM